MTTKQPMTADEFEKVVKKLSPWNRQIVLWYAIMLLAKQRIEDYLYDLVKKTYR